MTGFRDPWDDIRKHAAGEARAEARARRMGFASRDAQLAREREEAMRRRAERPSALTVNTVLRRDGNRCRYCGRDDLPLALDHLVPFSRGGTADPENLVAACKPCNSKKKNRTPEEAGMQLLPISGAP